MTAPEELRLGVAGMLDRVVRVPVLDEAAMWSRHDACLWEADRFEGAPFFYPVYRLGTTWSYAILPLLLKAGDLQVNPAFRARLAEAAPGVIEPGLQVDRRITRIGGPPVLSRTLRDRDVFVAAMARAMKADAAAAEAANPGHANVVLCGGKDSLNLLLLGWRNPTVAWSAEPNFPLVREFVARNGLGIEVRRLEEWEDPALTVREIAEAACLVDLEDWKWTAPLRRIATEHGGRCIIWKGQFADAILTDYWRSYTASRNGAWKLFRKAWRKAARAVPPPLAPLARPIDTWMIRDFRQAIWRRGAVLQGAHMGFLRSICDCLVLSGYHGPETARVWLSVDPLAMTGDGLREAIGQHLLGRPVWYPAGNPSPPRSDFRAGWRGLDRFEAALRRYGIEIPGPRDFPAQVVNP